MGKTTEINIKPIYEELQGILSQTPLPEKNHYIDNPSIWEYYHKLLEKIVETTGNPEYKTLYAVSVEHGTSISGSPYQQIVNQEYRSKINGLIMRLHGEFFPTENTPFGGNNQTFNMSQNQYSNMSVQISNVMEIQSIIEKQLTSPKLSTPERKFLERLKESLPTVKNVIEIINLVLSLGINFGLTPEKIISIFR